MKKVKRSVLKLRDLAYIEMRTAIMKGKLRPGTQMNEVQLTEQLGVSRTPLREAMALLEHEGLIETIPYKGTFVATIDRKTFEEVRELRTILECNAIDMAIRHIPKDELKELLELLQSKSFNQDQVKEILAQGKKLHVLIATYSGNETLNKLIDGYIERMHQYFYIHGIQARFDSDHLMKETHEHCEIIECLLEDKVELAKERMRHHLQGSQQRVFAFLDD